MRGPACFLMALLALAACGKPDDAKKPDDKDAASPAPGVTLTDEQTASLGLATLPAHAVQYRRQVSGYGMVLSLDTIAQADADTMTTEAAAKASQAAAARARSLATGEEAAVSRELVESAEAKAAADQAALLLARRKAESAFGMGSPLADPARRQGVRARLASGKAVVVRVTFPLGALSGPAPASLTVARLGDTRKTWTATTVWDAPADPQMPGRGFFVLIDGSDLAQSEHVDAFVPVGVAEPGVEVPSGALVYGENEAWIYVRRARGRFDRVRVDPSRAMPDGYFLPPQAGIHDGEPVVTDGAGLLLARELNPSTEAGD